MPQNKNLADRLVADAQADTLRRIDGARIEALANLLQAQALLDATDHAVLPAQVVA